MTNQETKDLAEQLELLADEIRHGHIESALQWIEAAVQGLDRWRTDAEKVKVLHLA